MEYKNFAELLVCLVDLNKGKYNFKKTLRMNLLKQVQKDLGTN